MDSNILKVHIENAVFWLTEVACNTDDTPVGAKGRAMPIRHWKGAIRGEYHAATGEWDSFCPVWHTGQAVKAVVLAAEALEKPELLEAGRYCAEFLLNNQFDSGENDGLIAAYEDYPEYTNTSAILECLDGLFLLSEATGDLVYRNTAVRALYWVKNHMWNPEIKLFYDVYDPVNHRIIHNVPSAQNRPLLDDAVFCKGWYLTGDDSLLQVAIDTAKTLLENEKPQGNWIKYIPCSEQMDIIHPRHAYWWGKPMLDLYEATGDRCYFECFMRSVNWYRQALRHDGGFMRGTASDFKTDSFGHATSGSACAVLMFLRSLKHWDGPEIREELEKGLAYCCRMQFLNPADPNLRGAILEKVLYPDGTDSSPYYIRDLGAIFFIQAASEYLIGKRQGVLP